MESCLHKPSSHKRKIERLLGEQKFSADAFLCEKCSAELWNDRLYKKFYEWIIQLEFKPRIQFKMSEKAEVCLDKLLTRFPNVTKAMAVRAMIAIYLDLLKRSPDTNELFNQISDSDYYKKFEDDSRTRLFPTDVKPIFYFDIQSWAKLFGMKPNEMASEAFHLMMALNITQDAELQQFWMEVILPQLETILKAA